MDRSRRSVVDIVPDCRPIRRDAFCSLEKSAARRMMSRKPRRICALRATRRLPILNAFRFSACADGKPEKTAGRSKSSSEARRKNGKLRRAVAHWCGRDRITRKLG